MHIERYDIVTGLRAAARHMRAERVLVADDERVYACSKMGLLVNSKPSPELNEAQAHVFMMALEYARQSEMAGAGSCTAMLELAIRRINQASDVNIVSFVGNALSVNHIPKLIQGTVDACDVSSLVNLVTKAGASKLVVRKEPAREDSVEFVDTYEFEHKSRLVEKMTIFDGARVLIVDGYIENVSEVHSVLDHCSRNDERLLMCCRGFSDDVLNTIAVNRARGSLECYALVIAYDEHDANTLVDIAVLLGSDVVSSLKGQLISAVDPTTLPIAKYARLHNNVLELNDPQAQRRMHPHVERLREKLETAPEESKNILERRLSRLTGSAAIVRLRKDARHRLRAEMWDLAFRTLVCSVRGVLETTDEILWPNRKMVPLVSVASAYKYSKLLVDRLENLSNLV